MIIKTYKKSKTFVVKVPAIGTHDPNNLPAYFPWIDTGITVKANQRIDMVATGRVNAFGSTYGNCWVGPKGASYAHPFHPIENAGQW